MPLTLDVIAPDIDFTRPAFQEDHSEIGYSAGDANPIWPLIQQCAAWGLYCEPYGDNGAILRGIKDWRLCTLPVALQLAQLGLEVRGYPAWLALPEASLAEDVPDFVANAYVTDEMGAPTAQLKTWAEWAPDARVVDGTAYIDLRQTGDVLVQLVALGLSVVTIDEVRAAIAAATPPE